MLPPKDMAALQKWAIANLNPARLNAFVAHVNRCAPAIPLPPSYIARCCHRSTYTDTDTVHTQADVDARRH